MQVNQAFVIRKQPLASDIWGNHTVDGTLHEFPWLKPLVEELRQADDATFPHGPGWTALICVDYQNDRSPIVQLEMKPPDALSWGSTGAEEACVLALIPEAPPKQADVLRYVQIHNEMHCFEADIIFDAHGLVAKVSRSRAGRSLRGFGHAALRQIVTHLKRHTRLANHEELRWAWGTLLSQFEIDLDPQKSGPQSLVETDAWIRWAESLVPPT